MNELNLWRTGLGFEADQNSAEIIQLSDGRLVAISNRPDGNNNDLAAQFLTAAGEPIGASITLVDADEAGQIRFTALALPNGGFALAYGVLQLDTDEETDLTFARFDASGTQTVSSVFATVLQFPFQVTLDMVQTGSRFFVSYGEDVFGATDTQGVVLNGDGSVDVAEFRAGSAAQGIPGIIVDRLSNGNIVLVNEDQTLNNHSRTKFTILTPDGVIVTGPSLVTSLPGNLFDDLQTGDMSALVNGGFVVAEFLQFNSGDPDQLYVSIFDNSGARIERVIIDLPTSGSGEIDTAALPDGGFAVRIDYLDGDTVNELFLFSDTGVLLDQIGISDEQDNLFALADGRILTWDSEATTSDEIGVINPVIYDTRDPNIPVTGDGAANLLTSTPGGTGQVNALGGDDLVFGSRNADLLNGGFGVDAVNGLNGDDTIVDNDFPSGDVYDGGDGIDTLDYSGVTFVQGAVTVTLSAGTITSSFTGLTDSFSNFEIFELSQSGETWVDGADGQTVRLNGGDDTVSIGNHALDGDVFDGGGGDDLFDLSSKTWTFSVTVDLHDEEWRHNGLQESVINFEDISGGGGIGERLLGDAGDNEIRGRGGNDTLAGREGIDAVFGGNGMDLLSYLATDIVAGEVADGGNGTDTLDLVGSGLYLFNLVDLSSIEVVNFSEFGTVDRTLRLNAEQIGPGIAMDAIINGASGAGRDNTVEIVMGSETSLDLTQWTFMDWSSKRDSLEVTGDGSNELIFGASTVSNHIMAGAGEDTISGGTWNDTLDGGTGSRDIVGYGSANGAVSVTLTAQGQAQQTGGGGEDLLSGFEGIVGSAFDDDLQGDDGSNFLAGAVGDDTLDARGGADTVRGGDDDDLIRDSGGDAVSDVDLYFGDDGSDTVRYSGFDYSATTVFSLITQSQIVDGQTLDRYVSIENIAATGAAQFVGDDNDNRLTALDSAGAGDNDISAGGGNDTLIGGGGDDTLIGGAGIDATYGGSGNDLLILNDGDAFLGSETLSGSDGMDTLEIRGGGGAVAHDLSGHDVSSIETLNFGSIAAGGDRDILLAADQIGGGVFSEQLHISGQSASGTVERLFIAMGGIETLDLSGFTFSNWGQKGEILHITGAEYSDIIGSTQADVILVGDLLDTVEGGAGADTLDGEDGVDTLSYRGSATGVNVYLNHNKASGGDAEGDVIANFENLIGSQQDDRLFGATGDSFVRGLGGDDVIKSKGQDSTLHGNEGFDTLTGGVGDDALDGGDDDDILNGGAGEDFLRGEEGNDTLNGNADNDTIRGGQGNDRISGGTGADTIVELSFETGNDTVFGGNGNDVVASAGGNDFIEGENGNDYLDGGIGNDTLTGGAGADTFVFGLGYGDDRIKDYEAGIDSVNIDAFGLADFNAVLALTLDTSTGAVMTFADGTSIEFRDVDKADLIAADFGF